MFDRYAALSIVDSWMEEQIKKNPPKPRHTVRSSDPLEELNRYFDLDVIPREECPNLIKYWGVRSAILFI